MMGHGGFSNNPTNYYNFPYWEKQRNFKREGIHCLNGLSTSDIYFNQIKQFLDNMNSEQNKNKT